MKKLLQTITVVLVAVIIALEIGCEIKIWNECRQTNSFLYCTRILETK